MKTINKGIITAAILGVSALAASAAQASDGTITIDGKISSQTCTINGTSGGNVAVHLPTVQTSAFDGDGSVAGRTGFNLVLTNCGVPGAAPTDPKTPGDESTVAAFFEQGPTINTANGYLLNQIDDDHATNVNVQLMNADSAGATKADVFDLTKDSTVTGEGAAGKTAQGAQQVVIDSNGSATLRYAAQYVAVGGKPTPGLVNTSVVYALNYK